MKKIIGIVIGLLTAGQGIGQNYYSDFQNYLKSNDTINQLKILKEWELNSPKDPELFTCYFNYYYMRSVKELVEITREKPDGESFSVKDSSDQTEGISVVSTNFNMMSYKRG